MITLGKKQVGKNGEAVAKNKQQPESRVGQTQDRKYENTFEGLREVVGKRGCNSKHFACGDGSSVVEFHDKPIHYIDSSDQKYREIDNTLTDVVDGFETRSGMFKTHFNKRSQNGKIFEMEKNNCKVALISKDAAKVGGCSLEICDCCDMEAKKSSKVMLRDVKNNVDMEYIVDSERVKENIIIHKKLDKYEFDFDLSIGNMVVGVSKDGKTLELRKKQKGLVEFFIPAPFMTDAEGNYSDSVYYEIEQKEKGLLSLKVIADEEWFNAAERTFPVVIDPQIAVNKDSSYSGAYYSDPNYYSSPFQYQVRTNGGQPQNGDLRIFYDGSKRIETDLIFKRSQVNSRVFGDNLIEAILEVTIDGSRTTDRTRFRIGDYHFGTYWGTDTYKKFNVNVTELLRYGSGNAVIQFCPEEQRGGTYNANVYFFPPVLKIKCKNFVDTLTVIDEPEEKYLAGAKFNKAQTIVRANYYDGNTATITNYDVRIPSNYEIESSIEKTALATYDTHVIISYEGAELRHPLRIHTEGFNDRRPAYRRDGIYKMYEVNRLTGAPMSSETWVRLELDDGAEGEGKGTPLNAENLNNIVVRSNNLRD